MSVYNGSAFGTDWSISFVKMNRINCEGRRNEHQVAHDSLRSQRQPIKYKVIVIQLKITFKVFVDKIFERKYICIMTDCSQTLFVLTKAKCH